MDFSAQTLQWLPIFLRVKVQYFVISRWVVLLPDFLSSLLLDSLLVTPASSVFLEHVKHPSACGLSLALSLPRILSPSYIHIFPTCLLSFESLLKWQLLSKSPLTNLLKILMPNLPFICLFFSEAFLTVFYHLLTFFFSDVPSEGTLHEGGCSLI